MIKTLEKGEALFSKCDTFSLVSLEVSEIGREKGCLYMVLNLRRKTCA